MKITIDKNKIKQVCDRQDIVYLGLFGSQSRGEAEINSDVDMLIDFGEIKSYFQLARVQEELENIFKKRVDIVLKTNIKDSLKKYILKDIETLYEKR